MTPESLQTSSRRLVLEMIGFTGAEKTLLTSTFQLTSRRAFCYGHALHADDRPDIYLVNGDIPGAVQKLQEIGPTIHAPAVLITRHPLNSQWIQVPRPIHWIRLFETLDHQVQIALRERQCRRTVSEWDGNTLRRARDGYAIEPVFANPVPAESVLVVDDSATVRAFMRAKLSPFRFNVDYAESGEAAIDLAQAKRYTCVFLDILMPGLDGYQVCKRLKNSPATRDSAVVMLSSKSSAFDKFRGNWAGCDAYLGKPVSEDELLITIARFLPQARGTAQAILGRTV